VKPPGDTCAASVSIFLPAYNERENLEAAVTALDAAAAAVTRDYEIIIVEDGSTDGTAALADELARRLPNVRAAHQEKNAGYGPAVLRGLAEATKEYVFYTDADRQYDYSQFATLFPLARRYDVLACYRLHRRDPASRLLFAAVYAFLLRVVFGLRVRDVDCSFKFLKRARIGDIRLESRSGFVEAELLLKSAAHGLDVRQQPVRHFERPAGKVSFEFFRRGPLGMVKPGPIWDMIVDIVKCRRAIDDYGVRARRRFLRRDMGIK
jgi:glycosyltransferase involved in cell wall biosynthesis